MTILIKNIEILLKDLRNLNNEKVTTLINSFEDNNVKELERI